MELTFPKRSTIAYSDEIIKKVKTACTSKGNLTFSLEDTTWMDPFGVTVLAGTMKQCDDKTRLHRYLHPSNTQLDDYLSQIEFHSFFNLVGKKIKKSTSVVLRQLKAFEPLYIDELITFIGSKMRLSEGVRDSLKMSLSEILTNVFDHSKSKYGCFICAQYYSQPHLIRLCVTDFGVGIPYNLRSHYDFADDVEAIKLSVQEGITTRPITAGLGLSHIRRFLKVNAGTLTIISGRGKVNFYRSKTEGYNMTDSFNGTIVNLKIKTDEDTFYLLKEEGKAADPF